MKRRILTVICLILIGVIAYQNKGFGLFQNKIVFAVGDLTVTWDTDPLFNETNIAPGFTQTKSVNVANGAVSTRPVGIRGILTSDTGNLASVMNIEIKEGATTLYSNTLSQFFIDSAGPDGIFLSNLNSGADTDYSFIVTFDTSAGNAYQNQTIIFDLQIGISVAVPAECQNIAFSGGPIFGTSGNDRINGTLKNDFIVTFEGNDRVFSHGGDDCIVGGEGDDQLRGETGNDVIFGNEGNDLLIGAVGNDKIFGGDGNDTIRGETGNDNIFGNGGDDKITGGSGNDVIDGGDNNDDINGEAGHDQIAGGNGNDKLVGGAGNDSLDGGADTDNANGQAGIDNCNAETETSCEI